MSLKEQLIGAWELVSYTLDDENGEKFYPLGEDCKGYLIYTEDGHVSAQLMASGRPVYASGDLHDGTVEEMAAAAHGYMAYSGRYNVCEETATLVHHLDISMNPTWQGQSQERYLRPEGDTITILSSANSAVLKWRKAAKHHI